MNNPDHALLVDFGSTYTKMVLIDMKAGKHLKSDHYPSTVATDASIALEQCMKSAEEVIGKDSLDKALKLLHPFMPYITEEIFQALPHDGDAATEGIKPPHKNHFFLTSC